MSEHTKEPWASAGKGALDTVVDQFGSRIAHCMNKYEDEPREYLIDYANARRIVACVNACAGLSQDSLDGGWTALGMTRHLNTALDQRNENQKCFLQACETLATVGEKLGIPEDETTGEPDELYFAIEELIAHRDELLAASRLILKSFSYAPGNGPEWYEAARKAVAREEAA